MSKEPSESAAPPCKYDRELGFFEGDSPGPTLIVTAAIHGNEIAGIRAVERVIRRLQDERPPLSGRLLFLTGNLRALGEGARYVDVDLNRQWFPAKIARLLQGGQEPDDAVENREQRDLVLAMRNEIGRARETVYFLDLHTSSAEGPPFLTVGDTLVNRRFAARFPLPVILGLEEQVDGSLLEYLNNYGAVTLGVEAGQHDSPRSIDRVESVLWLALVATGLIQAASVTDLDERQRALAQETRDLPRVIEVRHRHAIEPVDEFRMSPGFTNFQPIRKGQQVARDAHGAVLCPEDGLVLLPLYQGKGDDGFFVAREVRPLWIGLSGLLRRWGAGRLIRLLPGVRRHPQLDGVLVANTRIARLYPLETFHLFGFRKLRREGVDLMVSRRLHDLAPPAKIVFP